MSFTDVLKIVTAVAGVAGAVVAAAPAGAVGMIAAGSAAIISAASTLHMDRPKYSSAAQKPGEDSEEPK